jgi:hypothetical protein
MWIELTSIQFVPVVVLYAASIMILGGASVLSLNESMGADQFL